jgi:hypothetical protein
MVERFHRSLKEALKARLVESNKAWVDELPTVMLGLRTACRSDSNYSAAELVLGHNLRLPGDFYNDRENEGNKISKYDQDNYVSKLKEIMNSLQPQNRSRKDCRKIFVHKDLSNCSHVFIRNEMVRKPLTPCYSGPYQVISRSPKTFAVKIADRQSNISMDRLKQYFS